MKTFGQIAYEKWIDCEGVHRISGNLPWAQLHVSVKEAWEQAAEAAGREWEHAVNRIAARHLF
jgi:hypothetical protein